MLELLALFCSCVSVDVALPFELLLDDEVVDGSVLEPFIREEFEEVAVELLDEALFIELPELFEDAF
jgi:hypothetical protein